MENYSFGKSIIKGIKNPIIIFIGIAIAGFFDLYPKWAGLTLGGLLTIFYDWLKHYLDVKLP
jgi:hypothetical protein